MYFLHEFLKLSTPKTKELKSVINLLSELISLPHTISTVQSNSVSDWPLTLPSVQLMQVLIHCSLMLLELYYILSSYSKRLMFLDMYSKYLTKVGTDCTLHGFSFSKEGMNLFHELWKIMRWPKTFNCSNKVSSI